MNKIIPIGPYHPLQEEPELFKLYCDGEIVKDVKWETGYNHRGIEKLSESKTFDQVFFLVERICGICSTSHPFAFANCLEEIAGLEIPDRAKYIRIHYRGTGKDPQSFVVGWTGGTFPWIQYRIYVGMEVQGTGS